MPNDARIPNRWERAVDEVESYLSGQFPGIRLLNETELKKYRLREIKRGWQISVNFGDQIIALNILVPRNFPWRSARVALANLEKTLIWPHVEDDGMLCIYSSIDEFSVENPIATLQRTLSDAAVLIDRCIAGINRDDFKDEFQPYWSRRALDGNKIYSLVSATHITRLIKVWHSTTGIYAANNEEEIKSWLKNRQSSAPCTSFSDGLVIALPEPLLPEEYPNRPFDLMSLAQTAGANAALAELIQRNPESILTLLHMETANGPAFGPVIVNQPKAQRVAGKVIVADPLNKGFRPGRVPPALLVKRYLSNGQLSRRKIQRIDSSWLHSRDSDPQHSLMRSKRAAVVGCGSLGSSVAAQLAAAGIGELFLVDGEDFAWENIGRHYLGASHVGKNKAQALAEVLRKDYPNIKGIDTWSHDWETINTADPVFTSCDVIISAVGSWGVEGPLNEWHVSTGRTKPIIYAWLEPHALAAHALAIFRTGGCFACHLTPHGVPIFKATEWRERQTKQEPSCGAFFQPYGPAGLADGAGLASKLALDVLTEKIATSVVHTWIGRIDTIKDLGGTIAALWQEKVASRPRGEFVSVQNYDAHAECPWCRPI